MSEKEIQQFIIILIKDCEIIYNNKQDNKSKNERNVAYKEITQCVNEQFTTQFTRKYFLDLSHNFLSHIYALNFILCYFLNKIL